MTVTIQLQQPDGTIIATFPGEDKISIAQMAKSNDVEFPTSCGIGLCGICKCKIIAGQQYIQIDKISTPIKPLERHEDGSFKEVFACVGGINKEAINDQEQHQIILEKHI